MLKSPLEILWIDATYGDMNYVRGLLNTIIKQKMNVTRPLLDDIKTQQLKWYGHVQRMEEGRLPKESYDLEPTRKKKTR